MTIGHVGSVPIEPRGFISTPPIFKTLQHRVNAYDQAACGQPIFESGEKTFADRFETSTLKWGGRVGLGMAAEQYLPFPKNNPFNHFLADRLHRYASTTQLYSERIGLTHNLYTVGQGKDFTSYRDFFFTSMGRQCWKEAVFENFKEAFQSNPFKGMTFKRYFGQTFFAQDIRGIYLAAKQGLSWQALSRMAGLGMLGLSWFSKTKDAYIYAKAHESPTPLGRIKTLTYTAMHAALQAFKHVATWELGTIGFSLGLALIPLAGPVGIAAGIISGVLLSTEGYKVMGKVIPDPPQLSKENLKRDLAR